MNENGHIVSAIPAPAGLLAVYGPVEDEGAAERCEPVVALAVVEDYTPKPLRFLTPMVMDLETGEIDPASDFEDFLRLKWQWE